MDGVIYDWKWLMKKTLSLTECEATTLLQLSVNHPWRDARTRAAGLLMLAGGTHRTVIEDRLNVSHQSLYNWREAWENKGLLGLIGGHAGGRPAGLSEALITTAVSIAAEEALSLKGIAERIEATHQCTLPVTLETLGKTLKARGFSFKRTRMSLKKNGTRSDLPLARKNLPG